MAYEMKDGDFSLFKNDKKTGDNQPDYTGKCMVNGVTLRMAAWVKTGSSGSFFSGKISEFQAKPSEPVADPINPAPVLEPGPLELPDPAPSPSPVPTPTTAPEPDDLPF